MSSPIDPEAQNSLNREQVEQKAEPAAGLATSEQLSITKNSPGLELDSESASTFKNEKELAEKSFIVDWDGPDDKENPRNFPFWKKAWVTLLISLTTTSMYMGAAIVTPVQDEIQEHFHTTRVKTALGITVFVWGYGIGSLWFTPMSELPMFRGRNPTYFLCQFLFAILQIPTGLSNHVAPYSVLRFLAGIFASPPLATAGASISDVWGMPYTIYALIIWAYGAIAGPFVGPLIGAALTQTHSFRYIFWFLLAMSGGFFIILLFGLPETSHQEILMRKARRIRKETGDDRYKAPGDILMAKQTTKEVLYSMFYRPIKITIVEPIVLLMDIHLGLVYAVMYLYVEAIPIVYIGTYGWNKVEMGLGFMPLLVGAGLGTILYVSYIKRHYDEIRDNPVHAFGRTSIFGACLLPIGLLIWGWLERKDIHWVIGMIGNLVYSVGAFFMFESYFSYFGAIFPSQITGSVFASNNIVRSLMGGAFPLFGSVFYNHTATERYPVGWGCSIIALGAICMIPLPIFMYYKGEMMRQYAIRKYGESTGEGVH